MTTQKPSDERLLAEYVAAQESFWLPETVESVVRCRTNGPLLATAAALWIKPDDVVVDMTYGRGMFWTHFRPRRLIGHDIVADGVDFRQLPEGDGTVDVVVFDPPYIAMGGRDTSTLDSRDDGPDFVARYGLQYAPKTSEELADLIAAGIKEGFRILKPRGRLFVKCMDYVKGGGLFLGHHRVVSAALALGMEQVDEFVHHSGIGPQPTVNLDGSPRKQYHARRAHTFLCVFQAPGRRAARIDGGENGS